MATGPPLLSKSAGVLLLRPQEQGWYLAILFSLQRPGVSSLLSPEERVGGTPYPEIWGNQAQATGRVPDSPLWA